MVQVHRHGDSRACGATTVVGGQDFVFVDDKLWAVEGDPCSHGGGGLIAGKIVAVYINGKRAIGNGDSAPDDDLGDPDPASSGAANVTAS